MNRPDELQDLYELYALGVLEEPERSQIDALLRAGDPDAKERLRKALEYNAMILASTPVVEPPKRLRARVLASVGLQGWRWSWTWGWAATAAGLLVATFYYGTRAQTQAQELAMVRGELALVLEQSGKANAELSRVRQVLDFLNAPETRVVTFGPREPKPKGRVLLNPGRGVLLVATNLPPAPQGKIYEMWLIPKTGGKPVPAGLFQTDASGMGIHLREGAVAENTLVAVTLEPEAGSDAPTTTPLFVAGM